MASVAVRKFARLLGLLRSELPNQSDTGNSIFLMSLLDPKFAKAPAEQSCELRVRDIRLRAFVAAAVGALAFCAAAHAADAPDSWSPRESGNSPPQITELSSGWYLRGDLGYRLNRIGSVHSPAPIVSQKYDNTNVIGGGIGYKYQFLRADVTVDYGLKTKYEGTTATATAQPQYTAFIQPITVLANAYLDLGTWSGLTPYVGAGAGGSHMTVADYHNSALEPPISGQTKAGKWTWSWAWMAGLSYQVSRHWIIDAGYRQLHLGEAVSGRDASGSFITWDKLSAREFRVGLRFVIE